MKRRESIVEIARRVIAGLAITGLTGAAAAAQTPPRSVIIVPSLPDLHETPAPAPPGPDQSPARIERLNATVKVENTAGVSVDLIPRLEVAAGSKIGFHVATKKAGYLVLLAVDPAGKLTQIFPDPAGPIHGVRDATNLVTPRRPLILPQVGTQYAGFEFVADRATGIAVVVALLCDKPVQVVDLPDTPPPGFAPDETLKYVRDQARTLKVPNPNSGELEQPNWSIDGKFYLIR
jgi:Domain of unknown function (DUF4384)